MCLTYKKKVMSDLSKFIYKLYEIRDGIETNIDDLQIVKSGLTKVWDESWMNYDSGVSSEDITYELISEKEKE